MTLRNVWLDDSAQDIAEYAVMLGVILVVTLATIHAIANNATSIYSRLASVLASVM